MARGIELLSSAIERFRKAGCKTKNQFLFFPFRGIDGALSGLPQWFFFLAESGDSPERSSKFASSSSSSQNSKLSSSLVSSLGLLALDRLKRHDW